MWLGIKGYNPPIYSEKDSLLKTNRVQLLELIGRKLTASFAVWHITNNEWFTECPVILIFDGIQLEICFQKMNDCAVSWNTIDTTQIIDWYGMNNEFPLEWRKNSLNEINRLRGMSIKEVNILEYQMETVVIENRIDPSQEGRQFKSDWMLNGLEFMSGIHRFVLFNALDTNGIESESRVGDDIRRTSIQ